MNITPANLISLYELYENTLKYNPNNPILPKSKEIFEYGIDKNPLYCDYVPSNILGVPEYGQICDKSNIPFNRHTTYFARNDLDWYGFGQYLKSKYNDISDVDIHCFGCSTGQEAYTLALLLKSIYGDSPFVIHASDIDKKTIENNKIEQQAGIYLNEDNFKILQKLTAGADKSESHKEYLNRCFIKHGNYWQISPEIVNSVEFSKKNILLSTDKLSKTKPSIVLCRNMWPYVNPDLYYRFAEKLYNNLPDNSTVVIGKFDRKGELGHKDSSEFPNALEKAGFRLVYGVNKLLSDEKLVFEK